jgi:hypothetical protein
VSGCLVAFATIETSWLRFVTGYLVMQSAFCLEFDLASCLNYRCRHLEDFHALLKQGSLDVTDLFPLVSNVVSSLALKWPLVFN